MPAAQECRRTALLTNHVFSGLVNAQALRSNPLHCLQLEGGIQRSAWVLSVMFACPVGLIALIEVSKIMGLLHGLGMRTAGVDPSVLTVL